MFKGVSLVVLALCCALAYASPYDQSVVLENRLLKSFMHTKSNEPMTRNLACLEYYIPILSEIVDEYDRSWRECEANAVKAQDYADASKAEELKKLEDSSSSSCSQFDKCQDLGSAMASLECYQTTVRDGSQRA